MDKKKLLALCLAAFLVLGSISAYAYRGALLVFLDGLRDGDADGDGMPTRYEQRFDLDPLSDDRYEDKDADGRFNFDEFLEGLHPANPDTDGDHLADGMDRAPKDADALPLREDFDPGLLWGPVPLDLTRLECRSRAAHRVPLVYEFDLGPWKEHAGCIESPLATRNHAAALHPVENTPWTYLAINPERERLGPLGGPRVYADKDGFVHYEVEYTGIRERFQAEIANNRPAGIRDASGNAYRFATFNLDVPANPVCHLTFELQGYSGHDAPLAFDVRFYASEQYEPKVFEERSIVMAQRAEGGSFQADIPLPPTLTEGRHVLFVMPFLVDADLQRPSAPTAFAIHNANQRMLDALILNVTNAEAALMDGVPADARGFHTASETELANALASDGIDLARWNQAATLVESFAAIGVIPDASVHSSVRIGSPESTRLANAKGVVVTHEQGGKYHVATRSAALVNDEGGLRLVTRSTSETFTKLPARYAQYAEKGVVESSAHAVAVATEIGADAQTIIRRGEAETVEASLEKLRAGFGSSRTALDELNPKATFAKTAFRVAGSGLLILDLLAMGRHWEAATHATSALDASTAWGLFISTGLSAATIVLPFSPFALAIAAILAVAFEALLDPAFYKEVLDKMGGALQAVGGLIPEPDQRALFVRAAHDFAPMASAQNAPLFVGQFDEQGNAVTPAAFALSQEKVGFLPQLLIVALIGALVVVGLRRH